MFSADRDKSPQISRRSWIAGSGATIATLALAGKVSAAQKRRLAQVGTGSRGTHWTTDIVRNYSDVVEVVGLCDINPKRVSAAKDLTGAAAPTFVEFDRMIEATKPDVVLVTSTDNSHSTYIVRAMQLGLDVITEKPLCIDEQQVQAIIDAEKKYKAKLTVAFNARHFPQALKVKQLILDGAIGEIVSIDYQEYLNTQHGASYFRRWHRLKEMSGTLFVTKSCHHFDQVNWWTDSIPVDVMASGDLRFYGRNHEYRSTHCRGCPYRQRCQFFWDVHRDAEAVKLFVDCESEDGYQVDGCVWRQDVNIYDTSSAIVKYANGARLTYTANTFTPYEGQEIAINGTKGRIDLNMYEAPDYRDRELRLTRCFGQSEVIPVEIKPGEHDGADAALRNFIFRGGGASDPLQLKASGMAGAWASLVGIAAYRSVERAGERVKLADLVKV